MSDPADGRVKIVSEEVLSDDWALLKKIQFDFQRRDGGWERQVRQTYDRGDGAVLLPYDPARGTVLLVKQFRLPAMVKGRPAFLIEACAGLLDANDPVTCIRKEAEEELGYHLPDVRQVGMIFMSPGSVTEELAFFVCAYSAADQISEGGGAEDEGEDIEVLEMPLDEALAMTRDGRIVDAKTIMLLQHVKLYGLG
ncbi:MAG: NUDIX domain-containing protein [Caulobacteraceae bacterium]